MQKTDRARQDEARRVFSEASAAFELGREQLGVVVDRADQALRLVEDDASREAGAKAKPFIRTVLEQTKSLLDGARLNPTRADLRVALLCVALVIGVAGHPWGRTQSGAEYCHNCGSHRLVRTNRSTDCVDCGWREEGADEA